MNAKILFAAFSRPFRKRFPANIYRNYGCAFVIFHVTPPHSFKPSSDWTLLTFFIENHKKKLPVSAHHNLLMWKRRAVTCGRMEKIKCKSNYWWTHVRSSTQKIIIIKINWGMKCCVRGRDSPIDNSFFDEIIRSTFFTFSMMYPCEWEMNRKWETVEEARISYSIMLMKSNV